MGKLDDRFAEKKRLARKFKSRCFVCHKPFGKGFVFHHKWYDGNEPDFKKDPDAYFEYVFKQIKKNKKQFLLLCKVHHYFVEWGKRIADDKFRRFIKARKVSKYGFEIKTRN